MGRHANPDQGAFWRSLAAAMGKALLVLALLATITAAVASMAGRTGGSVGREVGFPATTDTPDASPAPAVSRTHAVLDDSPTPTGRTPTPTPATRAPATTPQAAPTGTPDVDGVQVQVIDAGGGSVATGEVVDLLDGWGYTIVAVNPGRCCYESTTVFFSEGHVAQAEALRDRDSRFVVVEVNTDLDQSVALHVVVGEDWGG